MGNYLYCHYMWRENDTDTEVPNKLIEMYPSTIPLLIIDIGRVTVLYEYKGPDYYMTRIGCFLLPNLTDEDAVVLALKLSNIKLLKVSDNAHEFIIKHQLKCYTNISWKEIKERNKSTYLARHYG